MTKLLTLFIALALSACAMGNQSELSTNQQKWQNANISHYHYNLSISCFCVFSQDMPLVIEVQDGQVVSMEYATGNTIDASSLEYFDRFSTIARIFEQLEKDGNGEADEVVATYDATYGFPNDVKIDYVKEATDDEIWFTVSDFEALP